VEWVGVEVFGAAAEGRARAAVKKCGASRVQGALEAAKRKALKNGPGGRPVEWGFVIKVLADSEAEGDPVPAIDPQKLQERERAKATPEIEGAVARGDAVAVLDVLKDLALMTGVPGKWPGRACSGRPKGLLWCRNRARQRIIGAADQSEQGR
jgi:hypothetical protein